METLCNKCGKAPAGVTHICPPMEGSYTFQAPAGAVFPKDIPAGTLCVNCGKPKATSWWSGTGVLAAIHGMAVPWCDLCIVREQLKHARERAAAIPALEALEKRLMREEESP